MCRIGKLFVVVLMCVVVFLGVAFACFVCVAFILIMSVLFFSCSVWSGLIGC